ncbi:MAG TPA: thiamine pyrophosphate-dependent enzyme [Bacteroidia bacterium]|nr:thiamine pyrophosphate-dependent enzyme [Bacteroidia bacterium]
MPNSSQHTTSQQLTFDEFKKVVLEDYRIAQESRQASLIGRKEVLTGKAKFGIFGDGKEVAQLAMAKAFKNGDFRSGYYRDQTFMFAAGILTIQEFFAQLYAHPDVNADPSSAGRLMNGHYATRLLNDDGSWKRIVDMKNSSADISPTAGQMPRLLGLAYASKLYRAYPELAKQMDGFTSNGDEVAFGTIGDASTSEGLFFEAINAAGVLQVPMAISVWDDGYGISVPAKFQTTKQNISEILAGFEKTEEKQGYLIFRGKGWDYPGLVDLYEKGIAQARKEHAPALFHIREMTQPQGHSTSGSHERYKSKERLEWEEQFDCIRKMREWIIDTAIANNEELDAIDAAAKKTVNDAKKKAWDAHCNAIKSEAKDAAAMMIAAGAESSNKIFIDRLASQLSEINEPERRDINVAVKKVLRYIKEDDTAGRDQLLNWYRNFDAINKERYDSHQYSQSKWNALAVAKSDIKYAPDAPQMDGREILQANWDVLLERKKEIVIFGEDVGNIGGVNQTYAGLQAKYGDNRLIDTGIREATIIGQGIGLALRGFRPIAEIQYLDYLAYAIQILSDDLACLQYRTKGGQKAPLIVTTRGHRLEGVWHSGSPMQFILGALRGMHVLVPRNMTQASGFYNTLLEADEPALVIEPLNAYRNKEKLPSNLGDFKIPIGVPEVLQKGKDVTLVTYGSCVRIAQEALNILAEHNISVELIDVQSLLPFDINHMIADSISKTNKVLFLDEDVPGGATAFMMQQVMENQKAFRHLDMEPRTLTAKEHRPAYGSDGDYYSKPSAEDVFDAVYEMMHDYNPASYPAIY